MNSSVELADALPWLAARDAASAQLVVFDPPYAVGATANCAVVHIVLGLWRDRHRVVLRRDARGKTQNCEHL